TCSKSVFVSLARPDAYRLVDGSDEDLAVTDLAGFSGPDNGFDHCIHPVRRHRDLDADFRKKIHGVFGAAVNLGVALLAAVALDLARGHSVHADGDQRIADLVQLEWLDDGNDQFHECVLSRVSGLGDRRRSSPEAASTGTLSVPAIKIKPRFCAGPHHLWASPAP